MFNTVSSHLPKNIYDTRTHSHNDTSFCRSEGHILVISEQIIVALSDLFSFGKNCVVKIKNLQIFLKDP